MNVYRTSSVRIRSDKVSVYGCGQTVHHYNAAAYWNSPLNKQMETTVSLKSDNSSDSA